MSEPSLVGHAVGNYVVREQVGEGGMGVVYRADHRRLSRAVAVKVLRADTGRNPELVQRFFNEARAASELRHPHVVEVLDFGELADGQSYIVMEWLDGMSLSRALEQAGRFPLERAVGVLAEICEALATAHARGIVHRDLKPDNVYLVERQGNPDFVKVLDFGIAKLEQPGELRQTRTGMMLGTPSYMSPEQGMGAHAVDHRSDIYSLGVIAFELVTGVLPFRCDSFAEMVVAHQLRPPPRLSEIVPDVPAWMEAIVARALKKTPDERYATVSEMHADLLRMGGSGPVFASGEYARRPSAPGIDPAGYQRRPSAPGVEPGAHVTGARRPSGGATAPTVEGRPSSSALAPAAAHEPSASGRAKTALLPGTIPGATELPERSARTQARPARWRLPLVGAVVLAGGAAAFVALRPAPAPPPTPKPVITTPETQVTTVQVIIAPRRTDATITLDGATVPNPFVYVGPAQTSDRTLVITAPGAKEHREILRFGKSFELRPDLVAGEVQRPARVDDRDRPGRGDRPPGNGKRPGAVASPGRRDPAKPDKTDPLRTSSPLLEGLDEFMQNRPKPQKQEFPR